MIPIYSLQEQEKIIKAGEMAVKALKYVLSFVQKGITTQFLDDKFNEFLLECGGKAACLGYQGYPRSLCVSVNEEICHGIPGSRVLEDGDIVSVDLVVELDGYHGDTCSTIVIGKAEPRTELLINVTKQSLEEAIKALKPGMYFKEIGKIIEDYIKPYKFGIVKDYCGHGIGKSLHHDPQIVHYYKPFDKSQEIKPGMCFTIEPMVCEGKGDSVELSDGWTVISKDRSICVQFEHTILMKESGPLITTII